jgi:pimeloyl-ACP methyl ester carboxylesterase
MAGSTILLLHAFPLDARMWEVQQRALASEGHRVVAPHLPGEEPIAGLEAWARRVLGLVEGSFVLAGCSMGGYLAFELWRQAPQRIAGLALVDTRATPDSPEQRQARDDTIRLLGENGFEPFWEGLAPKLFAAGTDTAVIDRARRIAAEQRVTGLVTSLQTVRDRPDSRDTLPAVDVPVLVAVGEEDELTPPADAKAMVAELPEADFLLIRGAGHLTPLERPEEITQALLRLAGEVAA